MNVELDLSNALCQIKISSCLLIEGILDMLYIVHIYDVILIMITIIFKNIMVILWCQYAISVPY
jgi:hypothetical protein